MNARRFFLVVTIGLFTLRCGDGATNPAGGSGNEAAGIIVFVSDSAGEQGIGAMRADGTDRRTLVPHAAGSISDVVLDSETERVVFLRDGQPRRFDGSEGSEEDVIVRSGAVPQGWTESDRVLWTAPGAGGSEGTAYAIFTTAPDGSNVSSLEPGIANWSAHVRYFRVDGVERVAYRGLEPKSASQIFSMELDGSDLVQETSDFFSKERPTPSPDGRSIVYWVIRESPYRTLDMIGPASSDPVPLLAPDDFSAWNRGQVRQVAWSPDGTRLAVEVNLGSTDSIWLVFPDGRPPVRLNFASSLGPLVWSPDGRNLLIQHGGDVARVDLRTGDVRAVAETPSIREWPVAWIPG